MPPNPDSSAVFIIVGWGSPDELERPLRSLQRTIGEKDEILFVDNRQSMATRRWIESFEDPRISYVDPGGNRGFAGAVNRGIDSIQETPFDWVVIMSDDSLLDGGFRRTLDALLDVEDIGVVGPRVLDSGTGATVFVSRWVNFWTGSMKDQLVAPERFVPTGYVEGRCLSIRRGLLRAVGNLDETFFIYWEEADLCARVWKLGKKVVIDQETWVTDLGASAAESRFRQYMLVRNRVYFLAKHGNPIQLFSSMLWMSTVRAVQAAYRARGGARSLLALKNLFAGLRDGLRLVIAPPLDPSAAALSRRWKP